MPTPGFVELPAELIARLTELLGTARVITDPGAVETLSKDFYWYSPVLTDRIGNRVAAAAVKIETLEELKAVVATVAKARVPITIRAAATGNYGQSVPLHGGLVIDVSGMNRILAIKEGVVTAEPGARLIAIENQARPLGWELRCYPSTWVKATIGGFVGGGSGGIGSISWGGLRDLGTIKRFRILTVEEEPRLLTLEEADTLQAFHAYGTNGVIVEVQMRLAPARAWEQLVVAGPDWEPVLDFAETIARDDAIGKRLATVLEAPIPSFFKPIKKLYPAERHLIFFEIESSQAATVVVRAAAAGLELPHRIPHHEPRRSPMLSDYTWNHTTLWALKHDPQWTYLQSGFGANFKEQCQTLRDRFPGEILFHLEFVRGNSKMGQFGEVMCGGIPLVYFKSETRLREIIDACTEIGVFTANPHTCYIEEGSRDQGFEAQRALKTEADPHALLNPGKMKRFPRNPFAAAGAMPEFLFP